MKAYAKSTGNKQLNPYAAAYKNMRKFAQANPEIRLGFVNGHFGYFYKFGLITNGLGIPLFLKFFDKDFYKPIEKEFETPEDQKYCYDNASLKPVIKPFLENLENTSDFKLKLPAQYNQLIQYSSFYQSLYFSNLNNLPFL